MKLRTRLSNKPRGTTATALHIAFTIALPLLMYVFVRLDFGYFAVLLLLMSKWRMFAVKMRHWPANIRANAVDIFVGLSVLTFMVSTRDASLQLLWVAIYTLWLLFIKPRSASLWVGMQAMIGQSLTFAAIFSYWSDATTAFLVFIVWGVAYLCARHFLTAFDESMARPTAYVWAFFSASITWLSGHWLIFYGPIAQPALLLGVLSYGMAAMYYLDHMDKLTPSLRRQFIGVMAALVLFLIIFSDWSDKTI